MEWLLMESIHPTPSQSNESSANPLTPLSSSKVQFSGKGGEFFGIWIVNIRSEEHTSEL